MLWCRGLLSRKGRAIVKISEIIDNPAYFARANHLIFALIDGSTVKWSRTMRRINGNWHVEGSNTVLSDKDLCYYLETINNNRKIRFPYCKLAIKAI